jgi:hypothetical protein
MLNVAVETIYLIEICFNLGMIPNSLKSFTFLFNFEIYTYDLKIVALTLNKERVYAMDTMTPFLG